MNDIVLPILTARGKTASFLFLWITIAAFGFALPSCANEPYGTVELSSGGPYISNGRGLQSFKAALPSVDNARPTYLTFYNGAGAKPGFSFARVILTNQLMENYGSSEPEGMVIADRNSFRLKNTVTSDVTGHLGQECALFIEAEGLKGAQLTWVLSALAGPSLSELNPSETLSGRNIILHGSNFSPVANNNTVTFGGKKATVVSATRTMLTVKPPESVESGSAAITVSVNGVASNPINMVVRPMPVLTSLYPAGGPPGESLTIFGRGFARPPQANIVKVGPYPAQVVGATDTGGILVIIPDWGFSSEGLAVSVMSEGVPSRNNLIFYPYPHIFIEGSAF